MRKARGLRLSDPYMLKLSRLRRVSGQAAYALLEDAIDMLYTKFKKQAQYQPGLLALEAADETLAKIPAEETEPAKGGPRRAAEA